MGKGYPVAMRQRLVAAYHKELGSLKEPALIFDVHPDTMKRWLEKLQTQGHLNPQPHGGGQPRKLNDEDAQFLAQIIAQDCDITQKQMANQLELHRGKRVGLSTIRRELDRLGITQKKHPRALEATTERVELMRQTFRQEVLTKVASQDVIVLDETGLHLAMSPSYGYAPSGKRAVGIKPCNRNRSGGEDLKV